MPTHQSGSAGTPATLQEPQPVTEHRSSVREQNFSSSAPRTYWKRGLVSMLAIAGILVLAVVVSGGIVSLKTTPVRKEPPVLIHTVMTYETERMTVQEMIPGFGTSRPMQQVVLSAQVAGEVVETLQPLKIGQHVSATRFSTNPQGISTQTPGDVIARIDPQTYQQRLAQAEDLLREDQSELARLAQEKENLQKRLEIQQKSFRAYQKEFDRVQRLVQQGVLSESDLIRSELDLQKYEDAMVQLETELQLVPVRVKQVEARMTTHRNEVELAQLDVDRTTITSPISGQFSEIHVERGQYVRIGDPLVTVTNTDQVEIPVGIPLADYLKLVPAIRQGNYPAATLQTNQQTDFQWTGKVTRTAPVADTQTRTVEVYIVVDNAEFASPLLPGTFVNVRIAGPVYEQVIPIPRDAAYQNRVFVAENGRAIQKEIDPVAVVESIILVKENLQPKEQIIMTNLDILNSGDAVRLSEEGVEALTAQLLKNRLPTLKILDRHP